MMEGKEKKMINDNGNNPKKRIEFFKVYYDQDTHQSTDVYPKKEFLSHVLINLTMGAIIRNAKKVGFHTIKVRIFSSLSNLSFLASIGLGVFNSVMMSSLVLWGVVGLCVLIALASAFYAANDIIQIKSEYYEYNPNATLQICMFKGLSKATVINTPSKYKEIEAPKSAIDYINYIDSHCNG